MQSGLPDPLAPPPSFTARKSAASHLPSFELPPPPTTLNPGKFPSISDLTGFQPSGSGSLASVGNLLTPPNTLPSDSLSPPPSSITQSNNQLPQVNTTSSYSRNSNTFWPQPSPSQFQYQPASTGQWSPNRGVYTGSSLNSMLRGSDPFSPGREATAQVAVANEMYQLPPFPATIPMSAPASLPAMSAPTVSQQPMSASVFQQHLSNLDPSPTQPIPSLMSDPFFPRLPPTPSYYNLPQPSPSLQQQQQQQQQHAHAFSFSSSASSPPLKSPLSANSTSTRMSSLSNSGTTELPNLQTNMQQTSPQDFQRPFGQYPLPALGGPVMTNLHTANSQMALVGGMSNNVVPGFTSGHVASMQAMYGAMPHSSHHSSHSQSSILEKPFKCDQCMQSFNRNHDLKRHKRIHLAVKPYPCGHCDKSFSRKDALKRHILVKGCKPQTNNQRDGDSSSPNGRSEYSNQSSPADDGGPHMNGYSR